ncbi:MAG: hypothetical protein JNM10_09440 [Planctomycetia bacterium]|nr:hypothetical protein [Planctomycetia bacterium]
MPSPLGWTLIAIVITCFLALRRRRRTPLRLADGAPLPDEFDWAAFARGAREVAERPRPPNRERPMGFVAEWDLELVGPDGVAKERRHFKNLIVNAGLNRAKDRLFNPATVATVFGYVAIGTGALAETPVDVALGTEAARDAVAYTTGGTGVCTVDHTFPAGVGTGAITEVGLFDDPAAGNMFNRKTFPAINKTAGDALKASCTITLIAA